MPAKGRIDESVNTGARIIKLLRVVGGNIGCKGLPLEAYAVGRSGGKGRRVFNIFGKRSDFLLCFGRFLVGAKHSWVGRVDRHRSCFIAAWGPIDRKRGN